MQRLLVALTLILMVASCGGGGGGGGGSSTNPTASASTTEDMASAAAAHLSASFDIGTKIVALSWSDTFPAGTSYNIEQQGNDGSWTTIDSIPGSGGSGAALSWTHAASATTTFRVAAQRIGYEVPLDTSSGKSSVQITIPAAVPTIVLDQAQPIAGTFDASIGGGGQYASVTYFIDLKNAGSSTAGPSYSVALNPAGLTAGAHLLLARLAVSADFSLEIRLTIQVSNPEVAVSIGVTGTSGPIDINLTATSQFGISSVSASLDGNTLGTLTAPNGCTIAQTICNVYQFPVNATTLGSGAHTITAQATDQNGKTASSTMTVTFSNPPSLALTSPFDGELANGSLAIAGTFGTDKQGVTVSLNVTLGQLSVLQASASPFSGSFSLTGVKPGTYTLTAVATDSTGQSNTVSDLVTVTSSQSLVYQPVVTLGQSGAILAVAGSYVLYSLGSDGSIHLHSPTGDTVLPLGIVQDPITWLVTDTGFVFAQGSGSDRPGSSVYMWAPGGAAQNLSIAAGTTGLYDVPMAVHYPWVLWNTSPLSGAASDILYNLTTQAQFDIVPPSGTFAANDASDFFSSNGALTVIYWTESASTTGTPTQNVLRWDQTTNTSSQLTSDGQSYLPQTDGIRAAWESGTSKSSITAEGLTLNAMDLASGNTQVLSTTMSAFQLADGVLGWLEQTSATQAIKASDGTTTSTVSALLGTTFYGASGGYVVFEESGSLYAWSPGGGRQLIFDAQPGQLTLTEKTVYFTNGNQQVLYSVALP